MAKNYVQDGDELVLSIAGVLSGDPVNAGNIVGVALTDTDADGDVVVKTSGVFSLSVVGNNGTADTAISEGDYVYIDNGVLNVDSSKTLFGIALQPVISGSTTEIEVKIVGG
jgi:predicted RecA/RadA family phage recombinase